ncbi:RNA-binding protein [Mycoplasma sp. 1654_15]|uniref:RNA-binding protein n=1 Tax=Mycoplasma sp. 1654_15 TaxID=2725994 RepID=UPI0014495C8B|nr:RNA-binding protein [Mycoplasma sp. 1654_15]QJB71001.1 RNA-binding protein [Mycoplasma sp. 1654_15]
MEIGQVVVCAIKEIKEKYFWTDMPEEYQGVVFINEISNKFIKDLTTLNFKVGQKVKLEILTIHHANKKASLSFKNVNQDFEVKTTIKKPKKTKTDKHTSTSKKKRNYELKTTPSGFENLKKKADREIEEKWRLISFSKNN